jgi:chlorite dismutase
MIDIQRADHSDSLDLSEKGRSQDGEQISLDQRLYMQFMAFGAAREMERYLEYLKNVALPCVLYEDINDPYGIGLLTWSEDPKFFLRGIRPHLRKDPFSELQHKPEYTMLGRTYAIGYESDLEQVLISRPIQRVTDPSLTWVVWYPVRRSGAFEQLSADEQRTILMEHGGIGRAYGRANLAYDIRLACYGLDKNDNDFVIGLLGGELHPLSAIVERMRKTKQTSQYLSNLGPFFVGRVVWQYRGMKT